MNFFEALLSYLHLHVGTSPLQEPLGSHILFFDPISIYPSGQTYSIVEPIVLLDPTIMVFSDFSGLPQVGDPVNGRSVFFMRHSRVFLFFF